MKLYAIRYALSAILLISLVLVGSAVLAEQKYPAFQKGVCYATWDKTRYSAPESDASIKSFAEAGAEWVAIVSTVYQDKAYTTKIFSTAKTPNDSSLVHAIQYAHSLGLKVMLKPHLDLQNVEGGGWRGEISYATEAEWEEWFRNYADIMLHYAEMAQANGVELFCIGTELTSVATTKEKLWREKIIAPIRGIYKGLLTYAANWNEEYRYIKFWDALDYVGIDAYFPLSDNDSPSLDEIKTGWAKWVQDLEEFQTKINKPVIFPEVGYCSADGAARTPWEELVTNKVNLQLQADCYEALFSVFWDKEWFYGTYWWRWGTDTRFGGPSNKTFTPQNKPAEDIIKKWYKQPSPR